MEASLSQSFLVVKNSRPQESCKDLCSSNVGLVPPLKPPMQALPNVRILFTALVQIPRRAAGAHLDPLQAQGSDQRRSLVPRYRQLQCPGQFSRWLLKVSLKKVNSQKLKTLFGLMFRCPFFLSWTISVPQAVSVLLSLLIVSWVDFLVVWNRNTSMSHSCAKFLFFFSLSRRD